MSKSPWANLFGAFASAAVDVAASEVKKECGLPGTRPGPPPAEFDSVAEEAAGITGNPARWLSADLAVLTVVHQGRAWKVALKRREVFVDVEVHTPIPDAGPKLWEYLLAHNQGWLFGGWAVREQDGQRVFYCKSTQALSALTGAALLTVAAYVVANAHQVCDRFRV